MSEARSQGDARQFVLLCEDRIHDVYFDYWGDYLAQEGIGVAWVRTPSELICHCLQSSPVCAMVDIATIVRGKSTEMNALFELNVRWPVHRVRVGSDGSGQMMRLKPPLSADLRHAMREIASGESVWLSGCSTRAHLRAVVKLRGRYRRVGEDAAQMRTTNLRALSIGGCYVVTYEELDVGDALELEILDIDAGAVMVRANVVWIRRWSESSQLPGAGLGFEVDALPDALHAALGDTGVILGLC